MLPRSHGLLYGDQMAPSSRQLISEVGHAPTFLRVRQAAKLALRYPARHADHLASWMTLPPTARSGMDPGFLKSSDVLSLLLGLLWQTINNRHHLLQLQKNNFNPPMRDGLAGSVCCQRQVGPPKHVRVRMPFQLWSLLPLRACARIFVHACVHVRARVRQFSTHSSIAGFN